MHPIVRGAVVGFAIPFAVLLLWFAAALVSTVLQPPPRGVNAGGFLWAGMVLAFPAVLAGALVSGCVGLACRAGSRPARGEGSASATRPSPPE